MISTLYFFVAAAVICFIAIMLLRSLSIRYGWLDKPNDRKQHKSPTPPVGGAGIFLGMVLPAMWFFDVNYQTIWFFIGAVMIMVVGAMDDRLDLNWRLRIFVHALAGLFLVYGAELRAENVGQLFGFGDIELGLLSVPFTLFITMALINAINMYDGIDGLVGSVCLAVFGMFVCASMYAGAYDVASALFLPIGALCSFLWFNLRRPGQSSARVFLGDAGSGLIGYTIAFVIIKLTQNPAHPISPVLGPYLLAPPIIDSITVIAHRLRQGKSPFAADRSHAHYRMLDAGFRVNEVVRTMVLLACISGIFGALCMVVNVPAPILVMCYIIAIFIWFWITETTERAEACLKLLRHKVFG